LSFSVWRRSDGKWLIYENLAKSICGYRHKNDTYSKKLPGIFHSREEAKIAVYDKINKEIINNFIAAFREKIG
jgi:hypothetical protein